MEIRRRADEEDAFAANSIQGDAQRFPCSSVLDDRLLGVVATKYRFFSLVDPVQGGKLPSEVRGELRFSAYSARPQTERRAMDLRPQAFSPQT
jgi:hypothetical protein